MHYILPTEALAIQQAAVALRDVQERCRRAAYPIIDVAELDDSDMETHRAIRALTEQVRINAAIAEVAQSAEGLLHETVNTAHAYGECQSSRQALDHWRDGDWTGPEFSVKR